MSTRKKSSSLAKTIKNGKLYILLSTLATVSLALNLWQWLKYRELYAVAAQMYEFIRAIKSL